MSGNIDIQARAKGTFLAGAEEDVFPQRLRFCMEHLDGTQRRG